jgi:hypothetical protein
MHNDTAVVPFAASSEAFSVRFLSVGEMAQGHVRCIFDYMILYTSKQNLSRGGEKNLLMSARGAGIYEVSPIKVTAVKRDNKSLGGTDIGSDGDIVHIAETEELVRAFVDKHRGVSIAKVDEKVDLVICDSLRDLLFSAVITGEKAFNIETRSFGNIFCGNTCSIEIVFTEDTAISGTEFRHKFFFLVVRNDSYFHFLIPFT